MSPTTKRRACAISATDTPAGDKIARLDERRARHGGE
jgi:hypothetical protein